MTKSAADFLDEEDRKRNFVWAFVATLVCLYGPFSWLLFVSYPWGGYRRFWLMLWPVLPGFLAGIPFHPHGVVEFTVMGIATLATIALLTYVGAKGMYYRIVAAIIALAISIPSAILSYMLFRS